MIPSSEKTNGQVVWEEPYKGGKKTAMTDEQTKQAILGFTEFFKAITGNQDLKIPDEMAEKYDIQERSE